MKKLANVDGDFCVYEKDMITAYILNQRLSAEDKLFLIESLQSQENIFQQFLALFKDSNPRSMFDHKEEAEDFVEFLNDLATVDNKFGDKEKQLVEKIKAEYSIR